MHSLKLSPILATQSAYFGSSSSGKDFFHKRSMMYCQHSIEQSTLTEQDFSLILAHQIHGIGNDAGQCLHDREVILLEAGAEVIQQLIGTLIGRPQLGTVAVLKKNNPKPD